MRIRAELIPSADGVALFLRDNAGETDPAGADSELLVHLDSWPIRVSDGLVGEGAAIAAIVIETSDGGPPRLIPKKLATVALELIVAREREGDVLGVAGRLVETNDRLAALVALTPVYGSARHRVADVVGAATDGFPPGLVIALREMQAVATATFGRLEWDRAIAWFLEEVGELAQAYRQDHGAARLHEELGQVFTWILCLANICGVDVADAASGALAQEVARQRQKYGAPHPYQVGSAT